MKKHATLKLFGSTKFVAEMVIVGETADETQTILIARTDMNQEKDGQSRLALVIGIGFKKSFFNESIESQEEIVTGLIFNQISNELGHATAVRKCFELSTNEQFVELFGKDLSDLEDTFDDFDDSDYDSEELDLEYKDGIREEVNKVLFDLLSKNFNKGSLH